MADKEDRRSGRNTKIEQFAACALRGFGTHKVALGAGTYGPELEDSLRRQARSEKDHLWRTKCKVPISNRIAKAAASGRFGNAPGEGTDEVSITLSDCFALDHAKYRAQKWYGGKLESAGKEPHAFSRFAPSAKKQIRLFFLLYGDERAAERKTALRKLRKLHEGKPELFTVPFIAQRWDRLCFEYSEVIREGVRTLIRMLPEGANRDAFIALALSPYKKTGRRM